MENGKPLPGSVGWPMVTTSTQWWEIGLFTTVDEGSAQPDLMMHYGSVPFDMNTLRRGYPTTDNGFCLTPNVTQGRSRGTVRLRSLDFRDRELYWLPSGGIRDADLNRGAMEKRHRSGLFCPAPVARGIGSVGVRTQRYAVHIFRLAVADRVRALR